MGVEEVKLEVDEDSEELEATLKPDKPKKLKKVDKSIEEDENVTLKPTVKKINKAKQ